VVCQHEHVDRFRKPGDRGPFEQSCEFDIDIESRAKPGDKPDSSH
jgi:hypothetical protein